MFQSNCAICHEFKVTPLRRDDLGGYICLSCFERSLIKLKKN